MLAFSLLLLFLSQLSISFQWAGKTIALGTFASAEADEKCARAKALTRAWRSTMRPKPTREWVMAELERLGVRVVSGRLGRKAGEEDEPEEKKSSGKERQHSRLSYVEASLTVVILFGGLLNEILIPK